MDAGPTLKQARERARATRGPLRVASVIVCVVAGFMMTTSALASRGNDLRPARTTELTALVQAEADRVDQLGRTASGLRAEVDALTARTSQAEGLPDLTAAAERADSVPVSGPALTVTLTDAPASVQPAGVDPDLLVVHQQDIQAVVNALWSSGAEALTIQGQRVSSRTGIKCVGNTVVLHGVPYAPPYRITAIGDVPAMERALRDSDYLRIYRQYMDAYRLGYDVSRQGRVEMPAYAGPADFEFARVPR